MTRGFRLIVIIVVIGLLSLWGASPASADSVHVVNSTGDEGDANVSDGTCRTAGGVCTLRAAIEQANELSGGDVIRFNIPGAGPHVIRPLTELPPARHVQLDGTTQPGYSGLPPIEIDGSRVPRSDDDPNMTGLMLAGNHGVLRGIAIHSFPVNVWLADFGDHTVEGSYIGTNAAGSTAFSDQRIGIWVSSPLNRIGGPSGAGQGRPCVSPCNLVSGHDAAGIYLFGITSAIYGNQIEGNYIGTHVSGTAALGNDNGILLLTHGNRVGGPDPAQGNLIAGNGRGILIGGNRNVVSGNRIGLDRTGLVALPNSQGIEIMYGEDNQIGTADMGNFIAGNRRANVLIDSAASVRTQVMGNYIGSNTALGSVSNGAGIEIIDAVDTVIGGPDPGELNFIGYNTRAGIWLRAADLAAGPGPTGTRIQGNLLWENATGIWMWRSSNTLIGGPDPFLGNKIAWSTYSGISVSGSSSPANTNTTIQGNQIGIMGWDPAGSRENGIDVGYGASNTLIGGETPAHGNLISSNGASGIYVASAGPGLVIRHNLIGTTVDGLRPAGNGLHGVTIGLSSGVVIEDNTIASNARDGIYLMEGAANTIVQGNRIGTDITGIAPLGNADSGVGIMNASNNQIGGDRPNTIAYNDTGVAVFTLESGVAAGNRILGNHIFSNNALGIDLGRDWVTPNDTNDGDAGPNRLQNFPVIASAATSTAGTTVMGSLNSAPGGTYRIEFFANTACDPSGHGEGQRFLGAAAISTNAAGNAAINVSSLPAVPRGTYITATATHEILGDTSEFSACVEATPGSMITLLLAWDRTIWLRFWDLPALAASSKLTGKDVKVLDGLLTNAAYAMEKEDSQAAISTMVEFIAKVKGYHAQGSLDDKQAQMLIHEAEATIDLVKNPPKP